jgi:GNAT superfamily N-acetyltransferase
MLFGRVRDGDRTVAVGVMSFGFGWAGVHGMRTAPQRRGEGLAGRVLAGLAEAATARGIDRVFLQVEEGNAPARALYARAGLAPVWRYHYWRQ